MEGQRLRVAVLRGGRSSEHEISLLSAASVLEALDPTRYDAVAITIDRQGRWSWPDGAPVDLQLGADRALDVDVVIPVLHGPFGEDGTVQGLLEIGRRRLRRRRRAGRVADDGQGRRQGRHA